MNTDILDAHIRKLTKTTAEVRDYLQNDTYYLEDISRTSINFNSKHIAEFTLDRPVILSELPLCCQIAASYSSSGNGTEKCMDYRQNYGIISHPFQSGEVTRIIPFFFFETLSLQSQRVRLDT